MPASTSDDAHRGLSRRDALLAGGALALGAGAGVGVSAALSAGRDAASARAAAPVAPQGEHQAGVARPATPQAHALVAVLDLDDVTGAHAPAALADTLARATAAIVGVGGHAEPTDVLLDAAPDLTVTVGLGPPLVAAIDPALPGARPLPAFAGDDAIAPHRRGGDMYLGLYASDPAALGPALAHVRAALGATTLRWSQRGFRAPGEGTIARNPLGFHDGVIVPRGEDELDANVWIPAGPAAGGTVCVVRQLRLDVARFTGEPIAAQEQVIGRRRDDGSPLSGGGPTAEVDLRAKTPAGDLITPLRSHARAAHPSFTDSNLMLRRGYAYDNGTQHDASGAAIDDQGLLFICFQRELDDFARTQRRLDEADDLMAYQTPVSSGSFLVLPGFRAGQRLGETLVG